MYVYLRDNVKLLLSTLADVTYDRVQSYIDLIQLRKHWVKEEMSIEEMMASEPAPPLGIESDPYDLGELAKAQRDFRKERFEELLRMLDQAEFKLEERFWEQMWPANPSS